LAKAALWASDIAVFLRGVFAMSSSFSDRSFNGNSVNLHRAVRGNVETGMFCTRRVI
jgi:hypothetical protein